MCQHHTPFRCLNPLLPLRVTGVIVYNASVVVVVIMMNYCSCLRLDDGPLKGTGWMEGGRAHGLHTHTHHLVAQLCALFLSDN